MIAPTLSPTELDTLAEVSEQALRVALEGRRRWTPEAAQFPGPLRAPGAAFVTLRREERLLGCVGTMEAIEPLVRVVADRTLAAAFSDPRTRGVRIGDWELLDIEVSVLSTLEPLDVDSYTQLVEHVGAHCGEGLFVVAERNQATFLPSVHEQLPNAGEFVAALWHKAGFAHGAWPAGIHISRYTVTKAVSAAPRAPLSSEKWRTTARSWSS